MPLRPRPSDQAIQDTVFTISAGHGDYGTLATLLYHRRDSIQGTEYIANYFFLNLKVSGPKIQNLK